MSPTGPPMGADDWDERYAESELVWSRDPNVFVERETTDLPVGRALDVACGEGRNALWLADRGWQVTAMDFSFVAIDKARRLADHAGLWADWRVGDLFVANLPLEQDLVVVAYLQLPAAQRTEAMRKAAASLGPGGTMVVVAHDPRNLTEGTGGPQDEELNYRAEDVVSDLEGLGLEVVTAECVDREVPSAEPDGEGKAAAPRVAKDALVVVRRS